MTFTVSGRTLTRHARRTARKADWLAKLARNAGRKLNRLSNLVTMAPASLNPTKDNRIVLVYNGAHQSVGDIARDLARIQKVLGVEFQPNNTAVVKFSRMTALVELRCGKKAA